MPERIRIEYGQFTYTVDHPELKHCAYHNRITPHEQQNGNCVCALCFIMSFTPEFERRLQ